MGDGATVRPAATTARPAAAAAPRIAGMSAARADAYADCFAQHFSRLAGYAATVVGDRGLGHEIAQEAFTRLYARWLGVREPRAYVYLVATNLAREHWRRRTTETTAYADVARLTSGDVAPPDVDVRDLVERLPRAQRRAVLLRYHADLPVAEIAALTRTPEGTVKRLLHDARHTLALAMGGHR